MRIDSPAALAEYAAALKARKHAPVKLLVSMGTCGIAAGTGEVLKAINDYIAEHKLDGAFDVIEVGCMGLCYAEPVIMLTDDKGKRIIYGDVTPHQIPSIMQAGLEAPATGTHTIDRCWYYPEDEKPAEGETTADGKFFLGVLRCLGACSMAPVVMVNGKVYGHMTAEKVQGLLDDCKD